MASSDSFNIKLILILIEINLKKKNVANNTNILMPYMNFGSVVFWEEVEKVETNRINRIEVSTMRTYIRAPLYISFSMFVTAALQLWPAMAAPAGCGSAPPSSGGRCSASISSLRLLRLIPNWFAAG